jgi:ankyrin repeat protein
MSGRKGRPQDDDDLELSSASSTSEDERQQQQAQQKPVQRRKSTMMTQNILSMAQRNHHTLIAAQQQGNPHPPGEERRQTVVTARPNPEDRRPTALSPRPPPEERKSTSSQERPVPHGLVSMSKPEARGESESVPRHTASQGSADGERSRESTSKNSSELNSKKSAVSLPSLTSKKSVRQVQSFHANGDDTAGAEEGEQIQANAKVKKIVLDIREAQVLYRRECGDNQAVSKEELQEAQMLLERRKLQAANELNAMASLGSLYVDHAEVKRLVQKCIEELLAEGDKGGNAEVVQAFMEHISTIDFTSMILTRQYIQFALKEGYPKFLETFMSMPSVVQEFTLDELHSILDMAVSHPIHRVSMMTSVMRHFPQSQTFQNHIKEFAEVLQGTFEIVASIAHLNPNEDHSSHQELIDVAVKQPYLNFDTREAHDKQTIFSRAAREGDSTLVDKIIEANRVLDVNRVQSDGTNALQQAAARGHLDTVASLCRHPNIGPSFTYCYPGRGNVLAIVRGSKNKNSLNAIITSLRVRMDELGIEDDQDPHPNSPLFASPTGTLEHRSSGVNLGMQRRGSATRRQSTSFASPTLKHPDSAKRRSIAGGTAAGAISSSSSAETDPNDVVDGTNIIKILTSVIKPLYEQIKYEESFDPKGDDMRKLLLLKEDLEKAKDTMAQKVAKLGNFVEIRRDEVRDDVLQLLDNMITESSKLGGNTTLFGVLITRLGLNFDFVEIATQRNWFTRCVEKGSLEYLDILLMLPSAKTINETNFQTKMMFEACAASRIYRVDTMLKLFEYEDELNIAFFQDILKPVWQQTLTEIASLDGARPQEQRANRLILLKQAMTHPIVRFDPEKPDSTGHCVFSRACAEGDSPLVFTLLNPQTKFVKNVNAEYNGMTGIMHAIVNDRTEVLQLFIQLACASSVSVNSDESWLSFFSPSMNGTPLHVAILKGKEQCAALLKQAGVILKRRKSVAPSEDKIQAEAS